ncbi:MAG: hypothetical protein ACOC1O_06315 [bacterium]
MTSMFSKVKNSEFLSFAELLKLKVSLVLFFLFIFILLTVVPISIFEDFNLEIRILIPSGFLLLFLLSVFLLSINKVRAAMHFSIYTFIGLTVYYVIGSSHLYGYLVIFVTLSIIIFYQDIYTYILYGLPLTGYGVYYIIVNGEQLGNSNLNNLGLSNFIYQGILVGFYVIFLIHFILSDHIYESINNEYLEIQKKNKNYRGYSLKYAEDLQERNNIAPHYQRPGFQKSVKEVAKFFNAFLDNQDEDIKELVDFYFFLHRTSIDEILTSKTINPITVKYTKELKKYILNENSEMYEIFYTFLTQFKKGFPQNDKFRYVSELDKLFNNRANRLIALAMIYHYLKIEKTQYDKWGRIEKAYTHDEIVDLFQSNSFREIISYEDMTFFMKNQHVFENYLG